jgi:hypothetical protein
MGVTVEDGGMEVDVAVAGSVAVGTSVTGDASTVGAVTVGVGAQAAKRNRETNKMHFIWNGNFWIN